jgi:hypothetical protein
MPPELLVLIEYPYVPIAVLLLGALAGATIEDLLSRMRRREWREKNRWRWARRRRGRSLEALLRTPDPGLPRPPDAADQLRIVMGAQFTVHPLLNRSEARLFRELDRLVLSCNPGWQVMAQVSLGEILRSPDPVAYRCVNSKRVDLLLVDEACRPRHAIEYQGEGHYQGTAPARDAVKKEALRRAGVGYHEIVAGQTTPSDLGRLVEKLVDKPAADA